jgi:hypothetical protein
MVKVFGEIFLWLGVGLCSKHLTGLPSGLTGVSLWWNDVSLLGTRMDSQSNWFAEGVTKRIGNGTTISFWFDLWLDGVPLRIRYQSLFQVSDQCLDNVVDMGRWVRGEWEWNFRWRTNHDILDQNLLFDLHASLSQVRFSNLEGEWCWKHDPGGLFSVKSDYLVLEENVGPQRILPGNNAENLAS